MNLNTEQRMSSAAESRIRAGAVSAVASRTASPQQPLLVAFWRQGEDGRLYQTWVVAH